MSTFDDELRSTVARARRNSLADILWRSAQRLPDKVALRYHDVHQTYAELDATVNRTANALTERGVARGDRIVLLSHNNHAYVVTCLALARLGAIAVPVNFMLGAEEVAYIVDHAGASGAIVEDVLVPVAEEALAASSGSTAVGLRCAITTAAGGGAEGWEPFTTLSDHPDASDPDVAVADDDVLQLMYTSGTESRPKGVMMTSRSLLSQYVSFIVDGRFSVDDVDLHALPLFHVAAQHCLLMPDLYLGATSIILDGPDPATILETIEAEGVTKFFCPPTVWISLLRHPDFDRRDLSTLRTGIYGASIMPVEVIKELSSRLPDLALFNAYGQTEMSAIATILAPEDQLRKLGSAGLPTLNVETRLVDDDDQPVPVGMVGEIVHRSPHATLGYWNDPEKTAEAFKGGWFHSGDLGVMDDEGYLTVVDRKKDMIKTGGENVSAREVEEVVYQHPEVAEVAVFSVPHERWIEAVAAAVILREGATATPDDLLAFCRERLAGYKAPKYVTVVDALPKNASGKLLKRDLRSTYADLASG